MTNLERNNTKGQVLTGMIWNNTILERTNLKTDNPEQDKYEKGQIGQDEIWKRRNRQRENLNNDNPAKEKSEEEQIGKEQSGKSKFYKGEI